MRHLSCLLIAFVIVFGLAAAVRAAISDADALASYAMVAKALDIKADPAKARVTSDTISTDFATVISKAKRISSEELTVVVDASSAKVVQVINGMVWHEANQRAARTQEQCKELIPGRNPIEVIQAAEKLCRTLGQSLPPDLKPYWIRFEPKTGCWKAAWLRYIGGYPSEEAVVVNIDDVTGKLTIYRNSATAAVCATTVKISSQQAIEVAKSHMAKLLPWLVASQPFEAVQQGEPQLRVVYANYLLTKIPEGQPGTPKQPLPQQPTPRMRLAYMFRYDLTYKGSDKAHPARGPVLMWVDAETGEVVGVLP